MDRWALPVSGPLRTSIEIPANAAGTIMQGADTIGFEIATCGKPSSQKLDYRALSSRDQAPTFVHLSQLKGRSLSVVAGRFAEQIRKLYAQP
ncbi:hypothetical protein [Ascidiaceihabitans sp.]|uniref:hypothetical protein n=1 Tax=Ascidiaceihabitans sp. TaxID=1872644 RepID=UPI003296C239